MLDPLLASSRRSSSLSGDLNLYELIIYGLYLGRYRYILSACCGPVDSDATPEMYGVCIYGLHPTLSRLANLDSSFNIHSLRSLRGKMVSGEGTEGGTEGGWGCFLSMVYDRKKKKRPCCPKVLAILNIIKTPQNPYLEFSPLTSSTTFYRRVSYLINKILTCQV